MQSTLLNINLFYILICMFFNFRYKTKKIIADEMYLIYAGSLTILSVSNNILCAPTGAFDALCDNLNSPTFESAVGANDEEIDFLSKLMNSTVLQSLIQVNFNYALFKSIIFIYAVSLVPKILKSNLFMQFFLLFQLNIQSALMIK